jgi:hypothetical protein
MQYAVDSKASHDAHYKHPLTVKVLDPISRVVLSVYIIDKHVTYYEVALFSVDAG